MDDWQLTTPVVLLIFNRPDTTEQVFESIRQAQPSQLLVIADGPRGDRSRDAQKCAATREIIERVDWDCQVLKNYSDINLGCKQRVVSGIDWVFDTVEEAIILEDDCLPNQSFFRYCQELLTQYRDDLRVMHITGTNEGIPGHNLHETYFFSRRTHGTGWATWRRAWQTHFDVDMKLWTEFKQTNKLAEIIGNQQEAALKTKIFDVVSENPGQLWDIQWHFACIYNQQSSILPNKNLVSNIGFGHEDATHTIHPSSFGNLPTYELDFPMIHPQIFRQDLESDDRYFEARQNNQVPNQDNSDELAEWI